MFNLDNTSNEMSMVLGTETEVKMSEVEELIYNDFKNWLKTGEQIVFNLVGIPGIGKTDTVKRVVNRLNEELELNIVFKHITQADLSGLSPEGMSIPEFENDDVIRQKFFLSPFAPDPDALNILFFDEITDYTSNAFKVVQKATDPKKTWGDRDLSNTYSVLAGNTPETTVLQNSIINTALSNRMTTIPVVGDIEGFTKDAIKRKMRPDLIAFVASNRELLGSHQLKENHNCPFGIDYRSEDPVQFGSTRAVSFLNSVWGYLETLNTELRYKFFCSRLGDYHGSLLVKFLKENSGNFKGFKLKDYLNIKEMKKSDIERYSNIISISDMDELITKWENYRRAKKIDVNASFLFFGDPGIGKTSVMRKIAESYSTPYKLATGSVFSPVNPAGYLIPNEETGRMGTMLPSYAPYIKDDNIHHLYILDELGDLSFGDGKSLIQGLTDNVTPHFAEYKVSRMTFVGLMNPVSSSHLSQPINFPTINRCSLFKIETKVSDTINHFVNLGIDNRIISFIEANPGSVTDPVIADDLLNGEAFSSPRSLYNLNRILKMNISNENVLNQLILGTIGDKYGMKFISFLKVVADVISPKEILRLYNSKSREDKIKLMNLRIDQSYLVSMNCSTYLVELMKPYITSSGTFTDKFHNLIATEADTNNPKSKYNRISDEEFMKDEYINAITGFVTVFANLDMNPDEQVSALFNIMTTAFNFNAPEKIMFRQFQRNIMSNKRVKKTIQKAMGPNLRKWISKNDGGNGLLSEINNIVSTTRKNNY